VIVGYHLPVHAGLRSAYVKVRERASYEYALVSAAAVIEIGDGLIARAALALGSVAQKPWRLPAAEAQLVGQPPTRDAVLPILKASLADARPLLRNGYKVMMAAGAAARAIQEAAR
jgi:xanthine dehydrogenase YagS FAD-binding subunit